MKESSQRILQMMTQGALEARAKTKFARHRSKFWCDIEEAASVDAPCEGAINLAMSEDAGALVALRAVGGGVGLGLE